MWALQKTDDYERRHRWYEKKRRSELTAVLDNPDTYFKTRVAGVKPLQIKAGFIHSEPLGVMAIDQRGGGRNLAETRLYVYPDVESEILYVITLGDKNSQRQDLALCREFVTDLRKGADSPDGQG